MKAGVLRLLVCLLMCVGVAVADECSDLARMFSNASQSMRVGDLSQLKDCVADLMQRKAQNLSGDLPDVPTFAPPGADSDPGVPHINLDVKPDSDSADSSRYAMPSAAGN